MVFSGLIVIAILVSGVLTAVAFMTGPSVLFAVGALLMMWACISMFAGHAVLLERANAESDARREH